MFVFYDLSCVKDKVCNPFAFEIPAPLHPQTPPEEGGRRPGKGGGGTGGRLRLAFSWGGSWGVLGVLVPHAESLIPSTSADLAASWRSMTSSAPAIVADNLASDSAIAAIVLDNLDSAAALARDFPQQRMTFLSSTTFSTFVRMMHGGENQVTEHCSERFSHQLTAAAGVLHRDCSCKP